MLGFLEQQHELFEVTVVVLGYYDPNLGDFINPRVPPESGNPIYIADDQALVAASRPAFARPETLLEGVMAVQRIVDQEGVVPSRERGGGRGLRMAVEAPQELVQVTLPQEKG